MDKIPGIKKVIGSHTLYYDDNDVNMIDVPLAACEGNYTLTAGELQRYFGIEAARMGKLPEYIFVPRLNSEWNPARSDSTSRSWWRITGEVVAYRPLEWVPIVHDRNTIPFSQFEEKYKGTTVTVEAKEIYGHIDASVSMSVGGNWKAIKAEVSLSSSLEVTFRKTAETKQIIEREGTIGNVAIKEIVFGLSLRMQRVYEHSVNLHLNDEAKKDSLTWDGSSKWEDLHIPSKALTDVAFLQYHPIIMTGSGHSSSLFLQALPVFNAERRLENLHVVVSCSGWADWYLYDEGTKTSYDNGTGRTETLPVPGRKPLVTFIPAVRKEQ
ncbi:hypothetical protein BGW41_003706 [Actinomortierella wolfii]|nr:hypothetical protein BGW41_003706 [Actinomortierella wolfii]